jgi:hypothetical protein
VAEHSLELVIRLVAPKRWKPTTAEIVKRVLHDKAGDVISAAHMMAGEWSNHGEPVEVIVEFREVER